MSDIAWHDLQHPALGVEYLAAGHELGGYTLDRPALVISTDEVAVFGAATTAEVIRFARRLIEVAVAGPKAPPLYCAECQEETGSVDKAGMCRDCATEAALADTPAGVR